MPQIDFSSAATDTIFPWVAHVRAATSTHIQGKFIGSDRSEEPVVLEYQIAGILAPELAVFKAQMCDLAGRAIAPIEVEFLKAYPQAASEELFLKPCAPLLESGVEVVDWNSAEETIRSTIKQFFSLDVASFGSAVIEPLLNDIYFLVTAKESTSGNILGFAMFAVTPGIPFGSVKMINVAVAPEVQERGLEQLLMGTCFKILPDADRLFTFLRPTNERAIERYRSLGFTQNLNPVQDPRHPVNLTYLGLWEYKANAVDALQRTSNSLTASNL